MAQGHCPFCYPTHTFSVPRVISNLPHPYAVKSKIKTIYSVFRNCTGILQAGLLRACIQQVLKKCSWPVVLTLQCIFLLSAFAPSSPPAPTHSPVPEHLCWAGCPARCGERARPSPPAILGTVGRARQVARQTTVWKKKCRQHVPGCHGN